MARARGVRVGKLIHQHEVRPAGEHGIDVKLFQGEASMLQLLAHQHVHAFDEGGRLMAAVCLHNAHQHPQPFLLPLPPGLEHGVGLAHPRTHAEENEQFSRFALLLHTLEVGQQRVGIRTFLVFHRMGAIRQF